jgi:hypothetical protein
MYKCLFAKQILFAITLLTVSTATTFAQSGGDFTITQSVIAAGGGQQTNGGMFSVDGTAGQPITGNAVGSTSLAITSGFWNFTPTAPTAATVGVGGRVMTASGAGIRNAAVTLTAQDGLRKITYTSSFGYYRFDGVRSGEAYVLSVSAKRFTFAQPTVVIGVFDEMTGLDFTAMP